MKQTEYTRMYSFNDLLRWHFHHIMNRKWYGQGQCSIFSGSFEVDSGSFVSAVESGLAAGASEEKQVGNPYKRLQGHGHVKMVYRISKFNFNAYLGKKSGEKN